MGLVKLGPNALVLSAADTYSGNTLLGAGTLTLGNSLALQNSTLDTSGSGALSFGTLEPRHVRRPDRARYAQPGQFPFRRCGHQRRQQ